MYHGVPQRLRLYAVTVVRYPRRAGVRVGTVTPG
jgi:hypothetical protein